MKILIAEERPQEFFYRIWLDETKTVPVQIGFKTIKETVKVFVPEEVTVKKMVPVRHVRLVPKEVPIDPSDPESRTKTVQEEEWFFKDEEQEFIEVKQKEEDREVERQEAEYEDQPDPAYIKEFSWGKDIPKDVQMKEMRLLCADLLQQLLHPEAKVQPVKLDVEGQQL